MGMHIHASMGTIDRRGYNGQHIHPKELGILHVHVCTCMLIHLSHFHHKYLLLDEILMEFTTVTIHVHVYMYMWHCTVGSPMNFSMKF